MKHKKIKAEGVSDGDPSFCLCDETVLYDGILQKLYRVKKPKWHSCEYIRRVGAKVFGNALIADKEVKNLPDGTAAHLTIAEKAAEKDRRTTVWQQTFARHMDYDRRTVIKDMDREEFLAFKLERERRAEVLLEQATRDV